MGLIRLSLPPGFDLRRAVCSYGYFILAPNRWDAATRTFHRPVHLGDRVVHLRISQHDQTLRIMCSERLNRDERDQAGRQLRRMLRLDEDFTDWFKLHAPARRNRFARLLRSPSFFEDAVKTITGCNVSWPNTVRMNALLCERVGDSGAFPTAAQVAALSPAALAERTKVGYRAERIIRLAQDVRGGEIDPGWFEHPDRTADELHAALLRLHGVGPYAAANLCQLLGHYDRIPIDTETYRHFCTEQGIDRPSDPKKLHAAIERRYAPFTPYAFLAYWFDLWRFYERYIGRPAWRWKPGEGTAFTATAFNRTKRRP
jgi:3-methyladenine DNA glycosylase/8-oxoguanine DNA glycosylase